MEKPCVGPKPVTVRSQCNDYFRSFAERSTNWQEPRERKVTKVSRVVGPAPLSRVEFRRIRRDASVPASGVTAAEFVGLFPRSRTSSVPLRSVACAYGLFPRSVLSRMLPAIRRAAGANKRRRIARRLARLAAKVTGRQQRSNDVPLLSVRQDECHPRV